MPEHFVGSYLSYEAGIEFSNEAVVEVWHGSLAWNLATRQTRSARDDSPGLTLDSTAFA